MRMKSYTQEREKSVFAIMYKQKLAGKIANNVISFIFKFYVKMYFKEINIKEILEK